ncbi:hypothetical protein Goe16_00670 [Bacillus phage vB_BsuM-Goe16]|nr:hypothetical protein Goe16_00670 [Bacillus phage vB_BsuM-Goe16]
MSNLIPDKVEEVQNHPESPKNFKYLFLACAEEGGSSFLDPKNFCIVLNTEDEVKEYRKKYLENGYESVFVFETRQMSFNLSDKILTLNYGY